MKKLIAAGACAFALSATAATAGNMAEPVMEPEVIVEDTATSDGGILVPLLAIILIGAAIAGAD
ncbi:hypothetical protein ACQ5SP_04690 [Rhodovulum sp. YNF3179]|uniref:hypothetical protein n=1 Tax=Rhodovulum sp. YNF3179 TaxID=3425127 RepID=UPI003D337803